MSKGTYTAVADVLLRCQLE